MGVRLALDTSAYIAGARGSAAIAAITSAADEVLVPFIVLAELEYGFIRSKRGNEERELLRRFLLKPRIQPLMPDLKTTSHYATLKNQAATAGRPVPTSDLWIGALAVQHGLSLLTLDAHFEAFPQIHLASPQS